MKSLKPESVENRFFEALRYFFCVEKEKNVFWSTFYVFNWINLHEKVWGFQKYLMGKENLVGSLQIIFQKKLPIRKSGVIRSYLKKIGGSQLLKFEIEKC